MAVMRMEQQAKKKINSGTHPLLKSTIITQGLFKQNLTKKLKKMFSTIFAKTTHQPHLTVIARIDLSNKRPAAD